MKGIPLYCEQDYCMEYDIALIKANYNCFMITPQLGLGYLSSFLKSRKYNALIIDGCKQKLNNQQIYEILRQKKITVAGITCLSAIYNEVAELSRFLKGKGITIIIGGVHPTFLPYQTLTDTLADYVVCGEGEIPLYKFLENNCSNVYQDGRKIQGIYSLSDLQNEDMHFKKGEIVENLDDLPYPDWEQMEPRTYPPTPFSIFAKRFPIGTVFSTRGCPYQCKFCASNNFYNKKVRFRSAENVVNEIKLLYEKYGVREIQFVDDNLTLKRDHVEKICELILLNNIKIAFSCPNGLRADKIDDPLVKLMKRAGFYFCSLGIESANANILKNIDKRETIGTVQEAIHILRRNGITTQGYFIFGLPGETKESLDETIRFALSSGIDRAHFWIFDVLPGCDLWTELKGQYISNLSMKSYYEPTWLPDGLTKEDLLRAQSNALRKFYLRPVTFMKNVSCIKPRQIIPMIKSAIWGAPGTTSTFMRRV